MMLNSTTSLLITIILFSCKPGEKKVIPTVHKSTVGLLCLGEGMDSMLPYMQSHVETFYGCNAVILPRSTVPQRAYYPPRNRYRADTILNFLETFSKDTIDFVAGFTNVDISASVGKYQDWGVFGLGSCPGPTCIISSFRLDNDHHTQQHLRIRVRNVLLHELGHNFGLPHCLNANCLMRAADGKLASVEGDTVTLCRKCKSELH